jgi:hypothetical protein
LQPPGVEACRWGAKMPWTLKTSRVVTNCSPD